MKLETFLNVPAVRKFVRVIPEGQYLFTQGQRASSMFFIIGGIVALLAEDDETEHLTSLLGAGEFLGEKAMLSEAPYQRRFSAQARSETTVLEMTAKDLPVLQKACPELIPELFKAVLACTTKRLDRANYLARALRPADTFDRFVSILNYCLRTGGKVVGPTLEVDLTPETIQYYIPMDRADIVGWIDDLVRANVLVKKGGSRYVVPSEAALVEYLRRFKKAAA